MNTLELLGGLSVTAPEWLRDAAPAQFRARMLSDDDAERISARVITRIGENRKASVHTPFTAEPQKRTPFLSGKAVLNTCAAVFGTVFAMCSAGFLCTLPNGNGSIRSDCEFPAVISVPVQVDTGAAQAGSETAEQTAAQTAAQTTDTAASSETVLTTADETQPAVQTTEQTVSTAERTAPQSTETRSAETTASQTETETEASSGNAGSAEPAVPALGDPDGDGAVTYADLALIYGHDRWENMKDRENLPAAVQDNPFAALTEEQFRAADLNGNGRFGTNDFQAMFCCAAYRNYLDEPEVSLAQCIRYYPEMTFRLNNEEGIGQKVRMDDFYALLGLVGRVLEAPDEASYRQALTEYSALADSFRADGQQG